MCTSNYSQTSNHQSATWKWFLNTSEKSKSIKTQHWFPISRWEYVSMMLLSVGTQHSSFHNLSLFSSITLKKPSKFNHHTRPLILQPPKGDRVFKPRPFTAAISPAVPAWNLCGRWRRGPDWASNAPRGPRGVSPAGKEVTSQPYLMGFLVSVAAARKLSLTESFFSSVRLKWAPERSQPSRSQQVWCNGRQMVVIYH